MKTKISVTTDSHRWQRWYVFPQTATFLCISERKKYNGNFWEANVLIGNARAKNVFVRKTFIFHSQDEMWATTLGGFPGGTNGKESTCQGRRCKRCGFDPWVEKGMRRAWQPTPVFLPGESHGQRSLAGYSPWGRKESDTSEWWSGSSNPLRAKFVSPPPHF